METFRKNYVANGFALGYIEQHQDRPPPIRIRKEWADSLNAQFDFNRACKLH